MSDKTYFHDATPRAVRSILEHHRHTGALIRLVYGDRATGYVWIEESDVVGRIGRSGGTQKIPLMITPGGDGIGGGAILDHCILAIQEIPSGKFLYKGRNIKWPTLYPNGTEVKLMSTGEVQARFPTQGEAYAYCAFMLGVIPCLPQHFVKEEEHDDTAEV